MIIKMLLGEKRNLQFLVKCIENKNAVFRIQNATYQLYDGNSLESEGACKINDHILSAFIEPLRKTNNYWLIITYEIANETLKDKYRIEVS